jgi:hypothetical protein
LGDLLTRRVDEGIGVRIVSIEPFKLRLLLSLLVSEHIAKEQEKNVHTEYGFIKAYYQRSVEFC